MIKNYNPRPFEQFNPLPTYVTLTEQYELLAKTKTGYVIKLAELIIGKSTSAGNQLAHVLFEGFSDHGERRAVARTRVNRYAYLPSAVMNVMMEVGVEFESLTPCHSEIMLTALGAWIQMRNPEIDKYWIATKLKLEETHEEAKNEPCMIIL